MYTLTITIHETGYEDSIKVKTYNYEADAIDAFWTIVRYQVAVNNVSVTLNRGIAHVIYKDSPISKTYKLG